MPKGFTLIELLIVLVIISVGVMTITPIMIEKTTGLPEEIDFFNELLRKTANESAELGRPIPIRGVRGSNTIYLHDGETIKIPNISTINMAEVNEVQQPSNEYTIMVYPNGLCDYFLLTASDRKSIESIPLLLQTRLR